LRTKQIHSLNNVAQFKNQLLIWAQQFDDVVWLDSNNYQQNHSNYDAILAVDAITCIQTDYINGFGKLKEYQTNAKDWVFGYLTYDLKNDVERLESHNFDGLEFPDLYFFQPKKIFLFKENEVEIRYLNYVDDEIESDFEAIQKPNHPRIQESNNSIKIKLRIHKDEYFEKVNNILAHIHRGDIYEASFCQEFYAENTTINPLETYLKLNNISKPPFATFLKRQVLVIGFARALFKKG
jgi:para-aminobenzoate synthetase component I